MAASHQNVHLGFHCRRATISLFHARHHKMQSVQVSDRYKCGDEEGEARLCGTQNIACKRHITKTPRHLGERAVQAYERALSSLPPIDISAKSWLALTVKFCSAAHYSHPAM